MTEFNKHLLKSSQSIMQPYFLNNDEVEKHLPINELVDGIERGFVEHSNQNKGLIQPQRIVLNVEKENLFFVKPAIFTPDKALGAKLLTLYPENETKYNLPSHQAVVTIFNSDTGSLEAVMDGVCVTDLRTAAASGVAFKHLTPKSEDMILTIIGTGHQAVSHLKIFREISKFKEIRVCSRSNPERAKAFALKWDVVAYDSVEQAAKNADVLVTVTKSSTEPVLLGKWVKTGAFVSIVGAPMPNQRDVDDKLLLDSFVIADSSSSAYASSGDVIQSKIPLAGDLGDIITGKLKVDCSKTRVFKSNGMAIQDIITGRIVVENIRKSAISTTNE